MNHMKKKIMPNIITQYFHDECAQWVNPNGTLIIKPAIPRPTVECPRCGKELALSSSRRREIERTGV